MIWGYARASSIDQSLDIQIADLNAHACEHIRCEKVSSKTVDNRPELKLLLEFMREGDVLMVTRLDRLARSVGDLCNIVKELEKKKCTLRCTQQAIETETSTGRLLVQILGVVAEFELEIRRERQLAGITKARAEGKYKGRSKSFETDDIKKALRDNPDMPKAKLARKLGCSRATIFRAIAESEVR